MKGWPAHTVTRYPEPNARNEELPSTWGTPLRYPRTLRGDAVPLAPPLTRCLSVRSCKFHTLRLDTFVLILSGHCTPVVSGIQYLTPIPGCLPTTQTRS